MEEEEEVEIIFSEEEEDEDEDHPDEPLFNQVTCFFLVLQVSA
jgi:hypothetical protein